MDRNKVLTAIYGKYNELESVKKYIKDEVALGIIEAKQDTLNDIQKMIESSFGFEE